MRRVSHPDRLEPGPQPGEPLGTFTGFPTAVFAADCSGRVTGWTAEAAALFDLAPEDALGLAWDAVFNAETPSRLEDALTAVGQGRSWSEVLHVKAGNGRLSGLSVRCSPLVGSSSSDAAVLCQVDDMEFGRRTESQTAFMDELMGKSPFGLVMIDEDLRYVLVNDALAAINGIPAQAHIGRRVQDIIASEDDAAYEKSMRDTLRTGEPMLGLLVSGRTEGYPDTDRAWSVSLFRLTGRGNQVLGLGGVVVDVTERQTALLEASAARQRLDLVNEASTRMGTSLELSEIARELSAVAVPAFADLAVVKVRDDLSGDFASEVAEQPVPLRRLAGLNVMNSVDLEEIFRTHSEVTQEPGSLLHGCMRSRRARLFETVDDEVLTSLAHGPADARLMRKAPLGSLIVTPFVARDRVLGVALFGRSAARAPMTDEDLKTALELAARTATCLDNALVYSNERRIAVALQRSMLPEDEVIPQPSGLDMACLYRPSSRDAQVGGDWFDIIPLSGHRIAFVVGDVMGHDIQAAANMGQLRTAMRTLAQLELEPADLFTHLDETVQKGTRMEYATCVYAVCDVVTRECSIISAGHPPPLLRHADGTTEVVSVPPGPPLGVATGDPEFAVTDLVLPPDSTLVLYTDGLIERRGEDIDVGIGNLRAVLALPAASAQELCDRVTTELAGSLAEDDLALLMARVPSTFDHAFARWTLPPQRGSVPRARSLVRQALHDWGLDCLVDTATLLVSELVTNAVQHAEGEIELVLAKGGALVCEVTDRSAYPPRRRRSAAEEEGGRGLAIVSEYSRAWGSRPVPSGKVVWFELGLPRQ